MENLHDIVSKLIIDTKGDASGGLFSLPSPDSSLGVFCPEILLSITIVVILLVRFCDTKNRFPSFLIALGGSLAALYYTNLQALLNGADIPRMEIFTGLLVFDGFTVFIRGILLLFAILFIIFTKLSGVPDHEDGPDVYSLVLGATIGMCLMASSNHLLMVFVAVEMASVPSYVLAGMMRNQRRASEAALKYAVYGAGAAGVMLYGISLIAGLLNTVHLPTIAEQLAVRLPDMPSQELMVLAIGGLLITVGLAFKLSAVPFHFWCPDVFEGATAEVNAFLSVASKAAALALLVRVAVGFGTIPPEGVQPGQQIAAASPDAIETQTAGLFAVEDQIGHSSEQTRVSGLKTVRDFSGKLIAFLAVITCTFGNLAAYGQTNIKRLLAYSTIAHAGYMMMAVPPIMALAEVAPELGESAAASLGTYIFVYVFMNLGAFAVVAFLRNEMHSEEIDDYGGLIRRHPVLAVCFTLMLLSLIGMPPLAGFIGKFAIFAALADGYRMTSDFYLILLLLIAGLNTAISLIYYMRVVKVMTFNPEPETRIPFSVGLLPISYIVLITVPTVGTIVCWDVLHRMTQAAATHLLF